MRQSRESKYKCLKDLYRKKIELEKIKNNLPIKYSNGKYRKRLENSNINCHFVYARLYEEENTTGEYVDNVA